MADYTCGRCASDAGAAAPAVQGATSGQDLAGIWNPGPLSVEESMAAQGYWRTVAAAAPATAQAVAPSLTLAALALAALMLV